MEYWGKEGGTGGDLLPASYIRELDSKRRVRDEDGTRVTRSGTGREINVLLQYQAMED